MHNNVSTLFTSRIQKYIVYVFSLSRDSLTIGYFDNFDNGSLNKYKKNLKNEKNLLMCSSTIRLMVIQISCNFIIV
jgi:hypothetical protein